jgi:hypothetical protein
MQIVCARSVKTERQNETIMDIGTCVVYKHLYLCFVASVCAYTWSILSNGYV